MSATPPLAWFVSDFWRDQLVSDSRQGLFLVLAGFVLSFGFIRLSTRLMRSPRVPWWPGSVVSEGGVHVHHLVFGIALMMGAGTLGFWFFDTSPWLEVCAFVFGIGIGLTLDEFALFVYLEDVYWAEEGRISIDATAIGVAAIALILLGVQPLELTGRDTAAIVADVVIVLILIALVGISFAKQRILHGAIGILLFPVAAYAVVRIGKPGSPWARRFYGGRNPGKQAKAEHRFRPNRRTERLKERFRDAIGGTTGDVYEARLTERRRGEGPG